MLLGTRKEQVMALLRRFEGEHLEMVAPLLCGQALQLGLATGEETAPFFALPAGEKRSQGESSGCPSVGTTASRSQVEPGKGIDATEAQLVAAYRELNQGQREDKLLEMEALIELNKKRDTPAGTWDRPAPDPGDYLPPAPLGTVFYTADDFVQQHAALKMVRSWYRERLAVAYFDGDRRLLDFATLAIGPLPKKAMDFRRLFAMLQPPPGARGLVIVHRRPGMAKGEFHPAILRGIEAISRAAYKWRLKVFDVLTLGDVRFLQVADLTTHGKGLHFGCGATPLCEFDRSKCQRRQSCSPYQRLLSSCLGWGRSWHRQSWEAY